MYFEVFEVSPIFRHTHRSICLALRRKKKQVQCQMPFKVDNERFCICMVNMPPRPAGLEAGVGTSNLHTRNSPGMVSNWLIVLISLISMVCSPTDT